MSIFDKLNPNATCRLPNDNFGHYWQRIDSIQEKQTNSGDLVSVAKTTVKVIGPTIENEPTNHVGMETEQAFWPDKQPKTQNFYLTRDLRDFLRASLGLSPGAANMLSFADMGRIMLSSRDGELDGAVVEVKVYRDNEGYAKTTVIRQVPIDEVHTTLDPETLEELGLLPTAETRTAPATPAASTPRKRQKIAK